MSFEEKETETFKVSEECGTKFLELKRKRKHRFVVFKLDDKSVGPVGAMWTVDSVGGRASSMEDLLAKLEVQHCRAAVLDWESKSADGRLVARLFFVCWLPRAASSRQKMAYACGKKALREQLDGVLDVHAQSHDEIKKAMGIEEAEDDGSDWEP